MVGDLVQGRGKGGLDVTSLKVEGNGLRENFFINRSRIICTVRRMKKLKWGCRETLVHRDPSSLHSAAGPTPISQ